MACYNNFELDNMLPKPIGEVVEFAQRLEPTLIPRLEPTLTPGDSEHLVGAWQPAPARSEVKVFLQKARDDYPQPRVLKKVKPYFKEIREKMNALVWFDSSRGVICVEGGSDHDAALKNVDELVKEILKDYEWFVSPQNHKNWQSLEEFRAAKANTHSKANAKGQAERETQSKPSAFDEVRKNAAAMDYKAFEKFQEQLEAERQANREATRNRMNPENVTTKMQAATDEEQEMIAMAQQERCDIIATLRS